MFSSAHSWYAAVGQIPVVVVVVFRLHFPFSSSFFFNFLSNTESLSHSKLLLLLEALHYEDSGMLFPERPSGICIADGSVK